jgi:hypothetical protein
MWLLKVRLPESKPGLQYFRPDRWCYPKTELYLQAGKITLSIPALTTGA